MGRRICIVGFSEVNRAWCADQEPDVEIWAINEAHNCTHKLAGTYIDGRSWKKPCPCYDPHRCTCDGHRHIFMPRYDRTFQLHPPDWKDQKRLKEFAKKGLKIAHEDLNCYGRNQRHVRFLRETDRPVYMLFPTEDFPTAVRYPLEAITDLFGEPWEGGKTLYATSTIAYQVLLALYEHSLGQTVSEIRLAGIELALGTEYFWQRPAAEHWLGVAKGMGIKVVRPPSGSALLAAPRYILDTDLPIPADFKVEPIPVYQPTAEQLERYAVGEVVGAEAAG